MTEAAESLTSLDRLTKPSVVGGITKLDGIEIFRLCYSIISTARGLILEAASGLQSLSTLGEVQFPFAKMD